MENMKLENLNIGQVLTAEFYVDDRSPVIKPFGCALAAADPSVLTPDLTPDGSWRLFCHTQFGVYQLKSPDGVHFAKPQKVTSDAMRPDINFIDGRYYLFYERTRSLAANALTLVNLTKWLRLLRESIVGTDIKHCVNCNAPQTEASILPLWIQPK